MRERKLRKTNKNVRQVLLKNEESVSVGEKYGWEKSEDKRQERDCER